ncbi:MAG: hypothetical protein WEB88_05005 [Gemmatimonadota bacterium]
MAARVGVVGLLAVHGAWVGGCGEDRPRPGPLEPGTEPTNLIPLTDLGADRYLEQFQGGLFLGGANSVPSDHAARGTELASAIRPLDVSGQAAANGRIGVLVVGDALAAQVACNITPGTPCGEGTLLARVAADDDVDHAHVRFVNGARNTSTFQAWTSATGPYYGFLQNTLLPDHGLSAAQIQAAWVHLATTHPVSTLPATDADARLMLAWLPEVLRALKDVFPNLRVAWLTSRVFGGYGTLSARGEPSAYETGFAVKWTIEAQLRQRREGAVVIPEAGDLAPDQAAPWITWGPYWWADGTRPRNDGLIWRREHFEQDGVNPSAEGEARMGLLLFEHLKSSPWARCWLLASVVCQ